jgi:2-methylcitrate dehydratase
MGLVNSIYSYSDGIIKTRISNSDSDAVKKRIADSIFAAYGARSADPVRMSMKALLPSLGKYNSRIYFSDRKASVDTATFINGSMTRYLDYNDTYLSKEALHPSDNIPPILAGADSLELKGMEAIKSIKVAYQVVCALADAASIRDRGWDHVTYISISSAAGVAALMGLDQDRFCNALNLAINNNISMRQTRAGELSMWKGCAAANAARNSVFAAVLAREGLTGPSPIFEGEMGFFRQVSGNLTLDLGKNRLDRTMIKSYPVEYHAMSGVDAALKLKERIRGRIKSVDVDTFSVAYRIIVGDREKLRPKTKETADHSLPYIIAHTLLYGAPNPQSYTTRWLSDKSTLKLINAMKFNISKTFDSKYPGYLPIRIRVRTDKGRFEEKVMVPRGHFRNPYSWDDLAAKGISVMKDENAVKEIISFARHMESRDVSELFDVIANVSA